MGKDILVILMIAFGLFAIVMFILFFIYLRKYYNSKHIEDDYKNLIDRDLEDNSYDEIEKEPLKMDDYEEEKEKISFEKMNSSIKAVEEPKNDTYEEDMEFVPIKKK